MRLLNKVAIVTGAAQGIGQSIATLFHAEGAKVMIADISMRGQDVASELCREGNTAAFVPTDVTRPEAVRAMVRATVAQYGRLDILINNAGVMRNGPTPELSISDWHVVIDTCLSATFYGAKYAAPYLANSGAGVIISIASIHGLQGASGWAAYQAAKGGLISLVRALAAEFGPKGIRVNAVSPGWIVTPEADPQLARKPADFYSNHQMLRRPGGGEEIAQAVLFLASQDASYVTGHNLVVDGGTTAWLCEDQLKAMMNRASKR